jgi:4-hydroxybutyryl-CoA dehydratase/vinylacetyl-CoA-Delta-isomerase
MKKEIFRRYPVAEKVELVENLLDRGILADAKKRIALGRQPGRCCAEGCNPGTNTSPAVPNRL